LVAVTGAGTNEQERPAMNDAQLRELLTRQYPFCTVVEPTGGWSIWFPDLPGCMSYAATMEEVGEQARVAFELWMKSEYDQGHPIPEPTIGSETPHWPVEGLAVPDLVAAHGDGFRGRR
jgi:predicted RNase H-like HicB family nuclease